MALQSLAGNAAVSRAVQLARQRPGPPAASTALPPAASSGRARHLAEQLTGSADAVGRGDVRDALLRRLRQGPLLSSAEIQEIQALQSEDPTWLRDVGLGTVTAADAYLQAGKYHDWVKLPQGTRLLIATRRWENHTAQRQAAGETPGPTPTDPPYQIGRHLARIDASTPGEEKDRLGQERDDQIRKTFVDTFVPPGIADDHRDARKHRARVEHANAVLAKVFLILRHGLKVYSPQHGTHMDYREGDVARALAHGGRVNIRIPQLATGEKPYALTNWLGVTKERSLLPSSWPAGTGKPRGYATHHMSIRENTDQGPGRFVEKGEFGATLANLVDPHTHLSGINLAAGGLGNKDFNGDTILPDGSYGHLFLGIKPPTARRDGALQIGVETAGPGATTPDGYTHGMRSSEKNSNPVSSFFGHKDDKLGMGVDLSLSQRHVDLGDFGTPGGTSWSQRLKELEEEWNATLAAARTEEQRRAEYETLLGPRPLPPA
ncbi:PE-PGRS family protein [Streptomyces sp. 6N223]|uniref:PE-PGRS family protein n=1 Tax=Streptomyces sp. 6N223 TaxID=3457412 RepID=UPI003FCF18E3